jgi:cephalosporin-C deacetylase
MPYLDMRQADLEQYRPARNKPHDLDSFWSDTLAELATGPVDSSVTPLSYPVDGVSFARATFAGFGGTRIGGWLLIPARPKPVPGIVFYHGYGWHKLEPTDYLGWALQGYAVFAVDVRGQPGESGDDAAYSSGHSVGFMTQGILDPRGYYYRYVYADCVRAVDVLASTSGVDPTRICVSGASQGGGLSLAVAALRNDIRAVMAGVPFLCHFRRAIEMADAGPYPEITNYLRIRRQNADAVFRTLSYTDVLNLADRITCPTLVSVALRDPICPPSTIYAAFNTIEAEKQLEVYPYHDHSLGLGSTDTQVRWAAQHLRA